MSEIEVEVQKDIENLLVELAEKQDIKNYVIELDRTALRGDGFLGEFFLGSVRNKDTNQVINLAIKRAFKNKTRREAMHMAVAYTLENHFYSRVFPELNAFQSKKVKKVFDQIPRYYLGSNAPFNESILLENIKLLGYELRDRGDLLDVNHAKFIFETYGRFHALSYAFKDQNLEKYNEITRGIPDYIQKMCEGAGFGTAMSDIIVSSLECFDPIEDGEVLKNLRHYEIDVGEILKNCIHYQGEHSCIVHGDCWSNNMMFKYNDSGELQDMKLLDFQLIRVGTPAYDLSYFFYTGGSKELFDQLDDFLKIYYKSFSDFSKELGSDPLKLLPFEALKSDWKEYSKFGILMSLMLTKVKLLNTDTVNAMTDDSREPNFEDDKFSHAEINQELFGERVTDILRHGHEMGAL